jgi:hypothetical protein
MALQAMRQYLNPELYRKMSEPFADADGADAALKAFSEDLKIIREKHRLADVHCVVRIDIAYGGTLGQAMWQCHIGSALCAQLMCAWALGQEMAEQRELLNRLASGQKLDC